MARTTIDLPSTFSFTTSIPVRITDLNYGGHVGNDSILTLMHEGRIQFLAHHGFSEQDFAGTGMIMGDVSIVFKGELFYGDMLQISINVSDLARVSFDLVYKLEKEAGGKIVPVAFAKTGMVCFDYERKKVVSIPEEARNKLMQ